MKVTKKNHEVTGEKMFTIANLSVAEIMLIKAALKKPTFITKLQNDRCELLGFQLQEQMKTKEGESLI